MPNFSKPSVEKNMLKSETLYKSNGKPVSFEIPFGSDQEILTGKDTQCIGAVSGTQKWITPFCRDHIYTICETSFNLP